LSSYDRKRVEGNKIGSPTNVVKTDLIDHPARCQAHPEVSYLVATVDLEIRDSDPQASCGIDRRVSLNLDISTPSSEEPGRREAGKR
jgi:hypothetical protein